MIARVVVATTLVTLFASCQGSPLSPDLARMKRQRKLLPYGASSDFADGRAMRPIPPDTVRADRPAGDPALVSGLDGNTYLARIPIALDGERLARGRDRYEIYCAVCHGMGGDGMSPVAHHMALRQPPSLLDPVARSFPPGRVFDVITRGYGLMPDYASQLPVDDRWSVVAYLQALQLSQSASLEELPPSVAAEAKRALP